MHGIISALIHFYLHDEGLLGERIPLLAMQFRVTVARLRRKNYFTTNRLDGLVDVCLRDMCIWSVTVAFTFLFLIGKRMFESPNFT